MRRAQEELAAEVLRLDYAPDVGDGPFIETWLDERAEGFRFLELVEQLEQVWIEQLTEVECFDVIV